MNMNSGSQRGGSGAAGLRSRPRRATGEGTGVGLRGVRPPRQARSRDKLQRMLDAAEELLDEATFETLTMAQIAKRAGVSVGLLYTRFSSKEAILTALFERYLKGLQAATTAMLTPERWSGTSVSEFVKELVSYTVRFHRANRGFLRSLIMHRHDLLKEHYDDPAARARSEVASVGQFLTARAKEIPHPQPRLAGSLGYLFIVGAVREKVLFSEGVSRVVTVNDRRLAAELTRAFLGYLGLANQGG